MLLRIELPEGCYLCTAEHTHSGVCDIGLDSDSVLLNLDWTGLDWTGLDWTGLDIIWGESKANDV